MCLALVVGIKCWGHSVRDPDGIEGPAGDNPGLGLLDVETLMTADKHLTRVIATHAASKTPMHGYEIHIGRTDGPARTRPFAEIAGMPEGAMSPDGRIIGSYLHGMFSGDQFRQAFLAELGAAPSTYAYNADVEAVLDALAAHLEQHLDITELLALAR